MIGLLRAGPRPVPARKGPAAAATLLIVLALPVFLVAGLPLAGWALAAVLWAAGEAFLFGLERLPLGVDHLGSSGARAVGMTFRGIGVMVVLIALASSNVRLAASAAAVYVLAYTVELGLSLISYFGGGQ
ncbi:MAG: hypothetical protein WBB74_05470 [Gaiellaceae bacterium]